MSTNSPFQNLDRDRLVHPPEAIATFIRRLSVRKYAGEEKRGRPRYQVTLPLIVQPVDAEMKPIGEPFRALTRDISTEGVGFYHTRKIDAQFAALEIENAQAGDQGKMQVLVEIRRCFPIHSALFEFGGQFVMRFDPNAPAPPTTAE